MLRRALRWAEQQGWVARNVAAIADGPKVARGEVRALELDEARQLLTAARGHRLEAAVVLALSLGLRRGELFGLTWSDVALDDDRPTVTVRRQTQRVDGVGMVLVELKTARSRRVLALPPLAVDALRAHRKRQAVERLALGAAWANGAPSSELVFTTADGGAVDPRNFHRSLNRLAKRAGIDGVRPHVLRHSAVSLLLDQGVPLDDVSELAGHSSVRVTKDCYGHLLDGGRQRAADAMQRALGAG